MEIRMADMDMAEAGGVPAMGAGLEAEQAARWEEGPGVEWEGGAGEEADLTREAASHIMYTTCYNQYRI